MLKAGRLASLAIAAIIILCVLGLPGCLSGKPTREEALVVACSRDLAGLTVSSAIEKDPQFTEADLEALDIGDCCGSNAQFTLATGDVDVAVLCPDAYEKMCEAGGDYVVLGTLVYDGNVMACEPGRLETAQIVGYMSGRTEQFDLLKEAFSDRDVTFQPLFTYAVSYALANDKVDAAMMDALTAMGTDYELTPVTEGEATSLLVTRADLASDPRVVELVEDCQDRLDELNADDDEVVRLLCDYLDEEDEKEVRRQWNTVTTRFGSLRAQASSEE